MKTLNDHLQETFGCKVYKIALNGGFTCPNRDGTLSGRGCIFCSAGGSGEFASDPAKSITQQIEDGKQLVKNKIRNGKYIAYFQAYTGTYAPPERLRELYMEAIATRPDCLSDEVLSILTECQKVKPVWVELGLQTIHKRTAEYIRRGYDLPVYDAAVKALRERGMEVITHVILGLPGETVSDMVQTVKYVCNSGATGIKLQLLHILKDTDLEKEYRAGRVRVLSEDEYLEILKACICVIPDHVVVHRLTGDGDKRLLVAPLWSADKKHVRNRIEKEVLS